MLQPSFKDKGTKLKINIKASYLLGLGCLRDNGEKERVQDTAEQCAGLGKLVGCGSLVCLLQLVRDQSLEVLDQDREGLPLVNFAGVAANRKCDREHTLVACQDRPAGLED